MKLRAEILVRQLLVCKRTAASGANDVPPFVDVDGVFLQASSVMLVLHNTVASYDATDKMKVEATNTCKPRKRASLSVLFFISGHFRCGASVEQELPSF